MKKHASGRIAKTGSNAGQHWARKRPPADTVRRRLVNSVLLNDGCCCKLMVVRPVQDTHRKIKRMVKLGGGTLPESHGSCRFSIDGGRGDRCSIRLHSGDGKPLFMCGYHDASPLASRDWERLVSRFGAAWPPDRRVMKEPSAPWIIILIQEGLAGLDPVGMFTSVVSVGWVIAAWCSLTQWERKTLGASRGNDRED